MSEKTEKLHGLQDLLIDEFIKRIASGEASPSDLNAARQLLKDNDIHAAVKDDNPLANLVSMLPFNDEGVDKVINQQWVNETTKKNTLTTKEGPNRCPVEAAVTKHVGSL